MDEFEIIFYDKEDGTEPAKEFILSLDKKMRTKMLRTIEMLQNNGYELREPYSKYVGEGIMELRVKVGSDISRVMYFYNINKCRKWEKGSPYQWIYKENTENPKRRN